MTSSQLLVALPVRRRVAVRIAAWVAASLACVLLVCAVAGLVVAHRAAPVLRGRIVRLLGERFGSPVALDSLDVHYNGALVVHGHGLRVDTVLHGVKGDPQQPMLRVRDFGFRVDLLSLLADSPSLHHVEIDGVWLVLPAVAAQGSPAADPKQEIGLHTVHLRDAHVTFASGSPDHGSYVYDFPQVLLTNVSRDRAITFQGTADNGPPFGLVPSSGTIGPWNFADPRLTPVRGTFQFDHRDVSSVRGIHGHPSMQGSFQGVLGRVDCTAHLDDPDFSMETSNHPVRVVLDIGLTIDATGSATAIQSVKGHFLDTSFVAGGGLTKQPGPEGFYTWTLQLRSTSARVQDVLLLGTHTLPPMLRGPLDIAMQIHMPPGPESLPRKLTMANGHFAVHGATFSNGAIQQRVDEMSERAQGDPKSATPARASLSVAQIAGSFALNAAVLRFPVIAVTLPGAQIRESGRYSLDGATFEIDGTVHTDAPLSHMTTGVKSVLARPLNGLFSHGRKGTTLPLRIRGVGDEPHFDVKLPGGAQMEAPSAHR